MPLTFQDLELDPAIVKGLAIERITLPTEIQTKVIPAMLKNRSVIFQAETGTGKTLAYLLPLFERYRAETSRESNVLILAPTHELTAQIRRQIETLAQNSGLNLRGLAIMGAANWERQIDNLKKKPRIIVGSAGRILELLQKRKINPQTIRTVILDEADQLMDEHNRTSILSILKAVLKDCQMIASSAALPPASMEALRKVITNPEIIHCDSAPSIPDAIEHFFLESEQRDKIELLRKLIIQLKPDKSLIFLNKPDLIEILSSKLNHHGIRTEILYGTVQQNERKKAMDDFRSGRLGVLIASDLAARGLHVEGITHIFNMDIPEDPKNYLHRAGRTGRMGVVGHVISLATTWELPFLKLAEKSWGVKIHQKIYYGGLLQDPPA